MKSQSRSSLLPVLSQLPLPSFLIAVFAEVSTTAHHAGVKAAIAVACLIPIAVFMLAPHLVAREQQTLTTAEVGTD